MFIFDLKNISPPALSLKHSPYNLLFSAWSQEIRSKERFIHTNQLMFVSLSLMCFMRVSSARIVKQLVILNEVTCSTLVLWWGRFKTWTSTMTMCSNRDRIYIQFINNFSYFFLHLMQNGARSAMHPITILLVDLSLQRSCSSLFISTWRRLTSIPCESWLWRGIMSYVLSVTCRIYSFWTSWWWTSVTWLVEICISCVLWITLLLDEVQLPS